MAAMPTVIGDERVFKSLHTHFTFYVGRYRVDISGASVFVGEYTVCYIDDGCRSNNGR